MGGVDRVMLRDGADLAKLPPGTERVLNDPFVAKSRKWRRLLYVAILAGVLALGWYAIVNVVNQVT